MAKMDILTLLEKEHRRLEHLLEDIKQDSLAEKEVPHRRIDQLCQLVTLHTGIEEDLLYNAAGRERNLSNLIQDAYHQHQAIYESLAHVVAASGTDGLARRCQDLQELLETHMRLEEFHLFPELRQHWNLQYLLDLGDSMLEKQDKELSGQ